MTSLGFKVILGSVKGARDVVVLPKVTADLLVTRAKTRVGREREERCKSEP